MPYVLVSAGILESMPADVGRIGAVLTSGNAAAAGPAMGVAGSAADEVWAGIGVLFCVAAVAYGNAELNLRNLLRTDSGGRKVPCAVLKIVAWLCFH